MKSCLSRASWALGLIVLFLAVAAEAEEGPPLVVWTSSPYVALGPRTPPPEGPIAPWAMLEAAVNEYEHLVLNVHHRGDRAVELRLDGALPGQVGRLRSGMNLPVQALAGQDNNPLKTKLSNVPEHADGLAMPLIELDGLNTFFVEPGQTRQIWLTVQTRDLEPGTTWHELRIVPLATPDRAVAVPVVMTVWSFRLADEAPIGVFCFDYAGDYRWLHEYKINLWFRGAFPAKGIPLNDDGTLSPYETDIKRVVARREEGARKFLFSYGYTGSYMKWAEEKKIPYMSPLWKRHFKDIFARLVKEWKEAGLDYGDFALQTVDEAHGDQVQNVIETTPLLREVDPKVRTAMTIMTDLNELKQMAPHVDVWLNRNGAVWSPEHAAFFAAERAKGKPIWSWNMPNTPKSEPITQFRTYGWRAMKFDFDAIGFFLYSGLVYDGYRPGGGIATRHWEAWRDGVEDYQYLWTLRERIAEARRAGVAPAVVEQAETLLARAVDEVIGETFFPANTEETHARIQSARRQIAAELARLNTLLTK